MDPAKAAAIEDKKRRAFKKFTYRGVDLDKLLEMSEVELQELFNARMRRKLKRGMMKKSDLFLRKLAKAKAAAKPLEKPPVVKTHIRNMAVVPEMVGNVIGIYNGKQFNQVEIKPEMIGHYLGEFSITYKPVKHGRAGIGATKSSRFIPLK